MTTSNDLERFGWKDITEADATNEELNLVYKVFGPRPDFVTPRQWRENMRVCAMNIRDHVAAEIDRLQRVKK